MLSVPDKLPLSQYRAMDIRLSGFETEFLPEESQPAELREYISNLTELYVEQSLLSLLSLTSSLS